MNGYALTASIVSSITSLAWPAAIAWGLWIFRQELANLLPNLRFRHGDTEISFRLEQAQSDAEQLPPPPEEPAASLEERSRFTQLAAISPSGAIAEAWADLEMALRSKASRSADIVISRTPPTHILIRVLKERGLVSKTTAKLLDELRFIRNRVVHGVSPVTTTDALQFREMATRAMSSLEMDDAPDLFESKNLGAS